MKKIFLLIACFICLKASAQINPVNDTTRISAVATYSPQFVPNIFNSGGINYRVTYMYNPSTAKYDAVIYSKYLRRFYLSKSDSSNYITAWQFLHGNNTPTGIWDFTNAIGISAKSFNTTGAYAGYLSSGRLVIGSYFDLTAFDNTGWNIRSYGTDMVSYGIRWESGAGQHSFNFGRFPAYDWLKIDSTGINLTGSYRPKIGVDSTSTLNTYSHLMNGFIPGTIANNNGWTLAGSAVGVNSGTQSTTITAAYTSGTDYALSPERFNQGKIRVLFHASAEKPMVTWGGLSTYFSISQTGGTATFGTVTGGVLTSLGTFTIPFTSDEYVQVNYSGQTAGSILTVKVWPINGTYPTSNTFTYTFTGSETAITGDQVTLRTLDATASQINSLDIKDEFTVLATKATFTGDWFKVSRGTHVYQSVIAQGAYFDFVVKSATYANLKVYADSRAAYQPQLEVSIDGGAYNLVTWSATGDIVVPIAAGMDATKDHRLTVYVKGIHELDDLWNSQEGFLFNDIVTDGHVTPFNNYTGLTAWYGDSIAAAIVAYGYAASPPNSQPSQSAAHLGYPQIAGRKLNQRVYVKGFGAAGLINAGHGNVPVAVTNLASFANGYPKYNNEQPNSIFLNYGTNDGASSSAAYIAAYNTYIAAVQAAYPRAKIFLIDQFNGVRTSDNSTVALNSTVTFVPTAQFVGSMTFITDGLHPDINGHDYAGNQLYNLIVPQLQPSPWTNIVGKGISYVGGSAMVYATNNVIRNSDGGSDFTAAAMIGSPVSTQLTSGSISPGASGTSLDFNKINVNNHNIRVNAIIGVVDGLGVGTESGHIDFYNQNGTGTLTKGATLAANGDFTAIGKLAGTSVQLGTGTSATVKDFNILSGSKASVTLASRSTLTSGTNGNLWYVNDATNNYGIASLVDNPNAAVGFSIRFSSTQPAFVVQANSTELLRFDSGSRLGLGVTVPTAYVHLKAGVAAAKGAPIKFSTGGIVLTTAEAGALEATNSALFYTDTIATVKTRREIIFDTKAQTLTNKTLTSPVINVTSDATGDIYYRNSGIFTRLPIGSTGQWLTVSGGIPAWSSTQSLIVGTPTVVAGTGAGTSPTVSVTSNGRGLQLTVTTGTLPTGTNATIATITLANALSYTPYPVFNSASALTSLLNGASMIYMTSTGTTNVTITSGTTALTAATTYIWNIAL